MKSQIAAQARCVIATGAGFAMAALSLAASLMPNMAIANSYTITSPGLFPGGGFTSALSINNNGQVVGYGGIASGGQRAFIWSAGGSMLDLGILPGSGIGAGGNVAAFGINEIGTVVGTAADQAFGSAYRWTANGGMEPLVPLDAERSGAVAYAINSIDQIAGGSADTSYNTVAAIWTNGTPQSLGMGWGVAYSLNDSGTVVGSGTLNGKGEAFRWTSSGGGQWLAPATGYQYGAALSINASGQIVGQMTQSSGPTHAVFWSASGIAYDLGSLGYNSYASDINTSGSIVGSSYIDNNSAPHALLWEGGVMIDLNNLIPANSGWVLEVASSINDAGQIVGRGKYNGYQLAYLLTPVADVPEPATATLLGAGLLGFGLFRRRRAARR